MRLFFGLTPSQETALEIDAWRTRHLPPMRSPVPTCNLHMTLVFLGQVDERRLEPLMAATDAIDAAPVALTLDRLGYFPGPGILWIGPSETPATLTNLVQQLSSTCRREGLRVEKRDFLAHLTIARRCDFAPPASTLPPGFRFDCDAFTLFESTNSKKGVIYRPIAEWPLSAR